MITCLCPELTAITTIPAQTCGENIGQIVKVLFQRKQVTPSFPTRAGAGAGDAGVLASWTALKAAVAGTKIQSTPYMENAVVPPAEMQFEGGGTNETLDGQPIPTMPSPIQVTGRFRSLPADIFTALETYNCELNLSVYLVNGDGVIWGWKPATGSGTTFQGIDIGRWTITDGGNEGYGTYDLTPFAFSLRYGWRKRLVAVKPADFSGRDL